MQRSIFFLLINLLKNNLGCIGFIVNLMNVLGLRRVYFTTCFIFGSRLFIFSFPWILKLLGHWACPTLVIGLDVHRCFLGNKLSVERSVYVVCVCVCVCAHAISGPVAVPIKWLISTCKFCPSLFSFIWTLLDARKSLLMKAFALKQSASISNPHINISANISWLAVIVCQLFTVDLWSLCLSSFKELIL